MRRLILLAALLPVLPCLAQEPRDTDPSQNIALGKPVTYLPPADYSITSKGGTDGPDLTDGKLTQRPDQHMWFEDTAVGWSYAGRANLSVDLGELQPIDEVAIRFLGGSPQAGICLPGWVEVMVSDGPGQPYYRVAEYSKWTPGDAERYGIPRYEGKAWVHRLRFTGLNTRGRLVGIRFYGAGLTCSDELYVFRGAQDAPVTRDPATLTNFTVDGAALYFHKPSMHVSPDIVAPVPIGCVVAEGQDKRPLRVELKLPKGLELLGGSLGGVAAEDAVSTPGEGSNTYAWSLDGSQATSKTFGRLYVRGAPAGDADAQVSYRTAWGEDVGPWVTCPIEVVRVQGPALPPKRLMAGLSWWGIGDTMRWPQWDEAFTTIGFNTVTAFASWLDPEDKETLDFVASVRQKGFKVQVIDSTWHRLLSRHKADAEIYCRFADGEHGSKLCPSYRGAFYEEELQRVAQAVKLLCPGYLHCDIELWGWRGPGADAQKCTRCQEDKAESGIESWDEWQLAKGEEMWLDLHRAVQEAVAQADGPACEMGVYDFRPGQAYQYFWPFDRLYPAAMQSSQVSTYTPLEPYHIALTGDEVREDRAKLPRSDQLPWISPGDAGTFSGEALYCALLECFCNGSRGVNFWSGRVWDADLLAGYARALRAVTPVEDVLIDGAPFLPAVDGAGRASGMKRGDDIVLLVADYHGDAGGTVRVQLAPDRPLRALDLDSGEELALVEPGAVFAVPLGDQRARVLHLRP